ncbi:oxidoreductase family protein [Anaeromyces robustus]|uniref:Oxidoreductase family protein n=1 Tax=Anaeromyces robustus TaxID=1754192 RepID=A0A1Y1WGB7_9FUNG|nr:oxidoreductase family protein [Anaeromyces robustus]|eukprot:ORX72522.1 oxidoreductase family protein [Anaeromyces robustus]
MSNSILNVLIVGWGSSAKTFHTPLITSLPNDFKITHVLERKSNNSLKVLPDVTIVRSLEELYDSNANIDLAVITTPNNTHYELTKNLLKHKINTVVEKPFVTSFSQAEELIKLAKENNVIVTAYQNRRWDGDFLTVKELIQNKTLGRIVEYESHFDRYRNFLKNNWKEQDIPGAGIVYDLASHLIDQALCLFGEPTSVYARIMNQRKLEGTITPDSFEIHLNYDNEKDEYSSLLVNLKGSMLIKEEKRIRFIVHGIDGSYIKYGLDVQEDQLKNGLTPLNNSNIFGKEMEEEQWGILSTSNSQGETISKSYQTFTGTYIEFYKNIAEVLHTKDASRLIVKPEEAANVIKVIELAYQSNKTKAAIPF